MDMPSTSIASAVAGCCTLMFVASAHAEPTPVSAGMHLAAFADPHVIDETTVETDIDSEFQVGTLSPMTVSVQVADVENGARVIAKAVGHATFKSASAGRVEVHNAGWTTKDVTEIARATVTGTPNGAVWLYAFTPDANAVFTIDWDIRGRGTNLEGLEGFQLLVNFSPFHTMSIDTADSVSFDLLAGVTYVVLLAPLADTGRVTLGTRSAHMDASFRWKIEP